MKVHFFLFLVIVFWSASANDSCFGQEKVQVELVNSFKNKFPGDQNIEAKKTDSLYIIKSVSPEGENREVIMNGGGIILKTKLRMLAKNVPTVVSNYFDEKYPDNQNYSLTVVEDVEGNISYYSSLSRETIRISDGVVTTAAPAVE